MKKPVRKLGKVLARTIRNARKSTAVSRIDSKPQENFTRDYVPKQLHGFTVMPFESGFESWSALSLFKGKGLWAGPFFQAKYRIARLNWWNENVIRGNRKYDKARAAKLNELFPDGKKKGEFCYVMALQGTKKTKKENTLFREKIGGYPSVFLFQELIDHAKKAGLRGIALLRVENNRWIGPHHSKEEIQQMSKLYYSIARKFKLKKVKHSNFLWLVFDK